VSVGDQMITQHTHGRNFLRFPGEILREIWTVRVGSCRGPHRCPTPTAARATAVCSIDEPDLFVVNSMDASSHAVLQPTAAAISLRNDGRVTVTSLSRFKFSCPLDLKWAPSDAHNCSISIGTMSPSTRLTMAQHPDAQHPDADPCPVPTDVGRDTLCALQVAVVSDGAARARCDPCTYRIGHLHLRTSSERTLHVPRRV